MRGRTGVLHSGHSVLRVAPNGETREAHAAAEASVSFRADVTDSEIAAYVATGEPPHVAGAFTVDSLGGAFIERVEGDQIGRATWRARVCRSGQILVVAGPLTKKALK